MVQVLGGKGDLLMYVTHFQGKDANEFEECSDTVTEYWGAEITYIPASEIVRLDYRRERSEAYFFLGLGGGGALGAC